MLKKLSIIIISIFLLTSNVNAGSDGELTLNQKNNKETEESKDCFEKLNRATFAFNLGLDRAIIKPVAKGYRNLPDPIQRGTSNAVRNLSTLVTIPNNVLQGDVKTAIINTARLAVNTTVGLLGTIDVANKMGFPKYVKEDYGQTLGAWGIGPGCYVVIPVLGPSTVRDAFASFGSVTVGLDPWYNITAGKDTHHFADFDYYASRGTHALDFRAKNITSFENLEKNSMDFYASVKSLYLQDRQQKIDNLNKITNTLDDSAWEEIGN